MRIVSVGPTKTMVHPLQMKEAMVKSKGGIVCDELVIILTPTYNGAEPLKK